MKALFTLLLAGTIITGKVQAQFSENFDQNLTSLAANCWQFVAVNHTTASADVINGTGSAFTNPPTSSTSERTLATPFLNMTSTSLTVSFNYKLSSKLAGQATRTLNIGITDKNGVFISLQNLKLDRNSPASVLNFNQTFTIPTTGVYRLEIKMGGNTGDGNSRLIFDDLNVSASPFYGPTNHCNSPADAIDDTYEMASISAISENVVLNDVFPNDGETYTAVLVAAPTQGTLVFNTDGTFTYTPQDGFTGGSIIFTYKITDDGYPSSTSDTATVTINYAAALILPVKLLNFTATVESAKVELKWIAEENHTGNFFEVERSYDGKGFQSIGKVRAAGNTGTKEYATFDVYSERDVFYRLKIVNKDLSVSYSKVIVVKGGQTTEGLNLLGNPVSNSLNFTYTTTSGSLSTLSIYAVSGVKVYEEKRNLNPGINSARIQTHQLQSGTYIVIMNTPAGRTATKFVKR